MASKRILIAIALAGIAGPGHAVAQTALERFAATAPGAASLDRHRIERLENRLADLEFADQRRRTREHLAQLQPDYLSLRTFVDPLGRERALVGGDVAPEPVRIGARPGRRSVALSLPDRGLEGPTLAALDAELRRVGRRADEISARGGPSADAAALALQSELTTIEIDIARLEQR